jgi:hypothetical protein
MILPVCLLTIEPVNPLQFSLPALRSELMRQLTAFMARDSGEALDEHVLHRYPAVQVKQIGTGLHILGICQGAWFLRNLSANQKTILDGNNRCAIVDRDMVIRREEFGIDGTMHEYEFLTPWLALNQQYARKFYDLSGKPARDAFMDRLLLTHLTTLAKSLDAHLTAEVTCAAHVRFKRERIDRENVIVFLGKFRTNLRIPDHLGLGQSVSQGFGTVRQIVPDPGPLPEIPPE